MNYSILTYVVVGLTLLVLLLSIVNVIPRTIGIVIFIALIASLFFIALQLDKIQEKRDKKIK